MNVRAVILLVVFLGFVFGPCSLRSEDADAFIVRDILVPPSLFDEAVSGNQVDPRERLAGEGITLEKDESIAYDPETMRLFVRVRPATLHRMEEFFRAERERFAALVSITYQVLETRRPLLSDTDASPGEPGKDPDSGTRVLEGDDDGAIVPASISVTKILSDGDEVDSLMRRVRAADLGSIRPAAILVANPGQTSEVWIGDALTRIMPLISIDSSSVELSIALLSGRVGADPKAVGETKLSIVSGGTVAFEEQIGETSWRTRLVTAVVVDPSGNPIPPRETKGLPGNEVKGPSGILFPGPPPLPAIEKVKSIIIPVIAFNDTPLLEAIERLNEAAVEHDKSLPESQRGVKIRFVDSIIKRVENARITMRLGNVPLGEAIRYTAALANCEYVFKGDTVEIGVFLNSRHAGVDGSDIWYAAFLRLQEADELEASGDVAGARSKRLQALPLYEVLRAKYPEFQPGIVKERIELLKKMLGVE